MPVSVAAVRSLGLMGLSGCSDETEAGTLGVSAACTVSAHRGDGQVCLTQFKGGYCGLLGCASVADCLEASACVAHEDGENYCFRVCAGKAEYNAHRSADNESNCSSNIVLAGAGEKDKQKACGPQSS